MKNLKSILFLGIVTMLLLSSCGSSVCESESTNTVYVFVDYTDQLNFEKLQENWEKDLRKINSLFPLETCTAGEVAIIPITDLGSNEVKRMSYKPMPADMNEFNPPVDYSVFKRKLKSAMKDVVAGEAKAMENTYLYEPMCHNLNKLVSKKGSGRKVAIFYSDMLEHSTGGSMYKHKKNLDVLKVKWPEVFGCELPNLNGTEIYVINHRNQNSDDFIRQANRFWKEVFAEKGARVEVASNLDF